MRNLYHRVRETPDATLVAGVAWLQTTSPTRLNNRHKLTGHVLSGRYKAQLVDGSGNGYLRTACDYVHLNPVRAKLLQSDERLLAYPWTGALQKLRWFGRARDRLRFGLRLSFWRGPIRFCNPQRLPSYSCPPF